MPSQLAQIIAFRVKKHVAVRWLSISTSTADFLHVTFKALRHVKVDDSANIRFVDAHSESCNEIYIY